MPHTAPAATASSVRGMANHMASGPARTGSSRMSAPLTAKPWATDTAIAAAGFISA